MESSTGVLYAPATTAEYFESVYAEAHGDVSRVPWEDQRANPALVNWLNAVAPSVVRCGARVAVVGCGLGSDARELMKRGYDVTAFDCSRTAVEWARRIDPDHASNYIAANLFDLPLRWRHRFDLVVEVNTLQVLPPEQRPEAMRRLAELISRHGAMLVVCRAAAAGQAPASRENGPPWPLNESEMRKLANAAGLVSDGDIAVFTDDERPPVLRMRALLRHSE
jgi:SAM-dependent methyltransferase